MARFHVMIVDDEVLAIQHLKQLVDWEEHGFTLAGESARPKQALSMIEQLKPDLIFVDIRMPQMDGLTFCKEALALNPTVKLILLSSYKEFEYAKEAIRLGVFNYLVKHELDHVSLTKELEAVRKAIQDDHNKQVIMIKQALRELTAGNVSSFELLSLVPSHKLDAGQVFMYILIEKDTPFPVIPGYLTDSKSLVELEEDLLREREDVLGIAYKESSRLGFVVILESGRSMKAAAELQFFTARAIQNAFLRLHPFETVSIVYSGLFRKLEDLPDIHRQAQEAQSVRFMIGSGLISSIEDQLKRVNSNRRPNLPDINAGEWEQLYSLHGLDPLLEALDKTFQDIQEAYSTERLSELCSVLIGWIDRHRAERKLPVLKQLCQQGEIWTEQWRTLHGIQLWLKEMVKMTFQLEQQPFSRKVREALEFMNCHFSKEISTEEIAMQIGLSGEHFRHIFKEETGHTVLDAITNIRMNNAKKLLRSGHYKLYEVAELVGYRSSYYFTKTFRKQTGFHPHAFVEQSKEGRFR
ncbi:response regulator [Paenibacillus sp. P36]|uniref:response regulator transcription factor n=1 Tax=Paenibacillus sp. P36 TaxID=3342538 RepID=UPI0038B3EE56